MYLLLKGQMRFHNNHVLGRESWILLCYPGRPPKAFIYLMQLNPYKLKWDSNPYHQGQYNLEENKFYDAQWIDLETYSLKN